MDLDGTSKEDGSHEPLIEESDGMRRGVDKRGKSSWTRQAVTAVLVATNFILAITVIVMYARRPFSSCVTDTDPYFGESKLAAPCHVDRYQGN